MLDRGGGRPIGLPPIRDGGRDTSVPYTPSSPLPPELDPQTLPTPQATPEHTAADDLESGDTDFNRAMKAIKDGTTNDKLTLTCGELQEVADLFANAAKDYAKGGAPDKVKLASNNKDQVMARLKQWKQNGHCDPKPPANGKPPGGGGGLDNDPCAYMRKYGVTPPQGMKCN